MEANPSKAEQSANPCEKKSGSYQSIMADYPRCPECQDLFFAESLSGERKAPLSVCNNGHVLCTECFSRNSTCPMCHQPLLKSPTASAATVAQMESVERRLMKDTIDSSRVSLSGEIKVPGRPSGKPASGRMQMGVYDGHPVSVMTFPLSGAPEPLPPSLITMALIDSGISEAVVHPAVARVYGHWTEENRLNLVR